MESTLRRTWAEIDLDALAHNYRTLRDRVGPEVKFLGVVKADAYGHGAVQVSRTLQTLGADYLAVSSIDEATELRCNGITMPILILGHTPREQVGRLIDLHITQAVSCQAKALEYSEEAVRCGGELTVHIKVDTGMSRLGYLVSGRHFDTGTADICAACALPGLRAEGIFTHFAVSDEPDADSRDYTEKQGAVPQGHRRGGGKARTAVCHTPLCQLRRRGVVPGDIYGHGAPRHFTVRLRRPGGEAGAAPGDGAQDHSEHHQDL